MKSLKLFVLFATVSAAQLHAQDQKASSNMLYEGYDCMVRTIKGGLVGGAATTGTVGAYAPYAVLKFGDLCLKRLFLTTSSADTFGGKSRKQLQKETRLAEFMYHGAQAVSSVSVAVYLWTPKKDNRRTVLGRRMVDTLVNVFENLGQTSESRRSELIAAIKKAKMSESPARDSDDDIS